MNVLLLEYDLYKSVGGGQTVYRRLIASNPDIQFYYLGRKEAADAGRPANAVRVPFQEAYQVRDLTGEFSDLGLPMWAYNDFIEASNTAASVSGLRIDVVDIPDYKVFGYFLAPALARHGQESCRVAVALHGNLSATQKVNWTPAVDLCADQREQWQYGTADIRYGLSRDYLEHWERIGGRAGSYLDPLRFLPAPRLAPRRADLKGVSLNFIGRTEGCKGPDLFLELLAWLPRDSYRTARLIGPGMESMKPNLLRRMAETRGLSVEFHPGMTAGEMAALYAEPGITVLTSRMDTLNLIAVESLYAGCPVAVSAKAGVGRFLRETYPGVPFATLDVDRLYAAAPVLRDLLRDYDRHREELARAMGAARPVPTGPTLREIYEGGQGSDGALRARAFSLYDRAAHFYRRHRTPEFQPLTLAGTRTSDALRLHVKGPKAGDIDQETDLWTLYRAFFYIPEGTPADVDKKVELGAKIALRCRADRARLWSELARLERLRGNTLVAATYDIRVLRLQGEDRTGSLPLVVAELSRHGLVREAETVVALYGPPSERLARSRELLERARTAHREFSPEPLARVDDRRRETAPRVSIVVSLYRAANKLEAFLSMLSRHEWVADGRAELVLVDSGSPTDEHAVFQRVAGPLGLSAIYARSQARETIQTAWNRGILLARAPYLCFLGVDETIRPECLPLLAGELDADPGLDWVQGSSVMTEVNAEGTPQRDAMFYQRTPYAPELVYLDTCYLSWAGAMFRKTIHDRLGFYDGSFGAAGDTEFKNRVLPFIRTKTLPLTLGVFLNYPEERATQSPRAELEDLRAWYLHRSEAGVEYAVGPRGPEGARELLRRTLAYRKSFCGHVSSDVDFAAEIVSFLARRAPGPEIAVAAAAIGRVHRTYRELDWLPLVTPRAAENAEQRAQTLAAAAAGEIEAVLGQRPAWAVFNDNRFEQHHNFWPAPALAGRQAPADRAFWIPASLPEPGFAGEGAAPLAEAKAPAVERLAAALRGQAGEPGSGHPELGADLGKIALYFEALAAGKTPRTDEGDDAGTVLCTVLAESQQGRSWSRAARFDARFARLCAVLAELSRPISPELADACEGLGLHAARELETARSTETAARLLTFKSPAEAVARYRAHLSPRVLETLESAAKSARAKGNSAYSERLITYVAAVKAELQAVAAR